jgi:hypothetical protein
MQHAFAWLAFPPVLIAASSGTNDLVAAALVALALVVAGSAGRSTAFLAVAGWVKLIPFFLVPVAAARFRSRNLLFAIVTFAAVTVATAAWILALGGPHGIGDMLRAVSFQSERGSLLSIWTALGARPLQPVAEAAAFGLVAFATARVWLERECGLDVRRLAALAGGVMLAFQLSANYWSWAYLPWVMPCILLALFPFHDPLSRGGYTGARAIAPRRLEESDDSRQDANLIEDHGPARPASAARGARKRLRLIS